MQGKDDEKEEESCVTAEEEGYGGYIDGDGLTRDHIPHCQVPRHKDVNGATPDSG